MQSILLATGENKKTLPLTETIPAPLLPVADRPVMSYAVELLARQNIKHILVSLYAMGGEIESAFGSGERWGVKFEYILQRNAWGSAGSLRWARPLVKDTLIVMPADVVVDLDIATLVHYHRKNNNALTLVVTPASDGDQKGLVLDAQMRVQPAGELVDGARLWKPIGVAVLEPHVIDLIPARTTFDIHADLIPVLSAAGLAVSGYALGGYWNPLDEMNHYFEAQRIFLHQYPNGDDSYPTLQFLTPLGHQIGRGVWVGRRNLIHPTARIASPVIIGENCRIGRDVELGPEVVIGDNAVIDDDATIHHSVILEGTYVGQLVNIENRVVNKNLVVDIQTAQSMRVPDRFLLDRVDPNIVDAGLKRLFDLALALPGLLVLLPISFLVGLFVLLTSGRIFKSDERVSVWGKSHPDAEENHKTFSLFRFYTRRPDGSFTVLGRWLEDFELHRLPELWNVIRGDLALVGVKPLSPHELQHITQDWQKKRYECPPGFTGLWYLRTNEKSSLDEVLVTDVYYVATRSWRQDIQLLWQTPAAWLGKLKKTELRVNVSAGE